jgi:hypothetical protein
MAFFISAVNPLSSESDAALPALLAKFTVRPAETGYFVART